MASPPIERALIWAVHRTQDWWTHVGRNLGIAETTVVTDRPGIGDHSVSRDFYAALRRQGSPPASTPLLGEAELRDVVARCRVLRWLPPGQAARMAHAMAEVAERLLDRFRPDVFLGWTIDNYVSDLIARRARARGIPTFEVVASAIPGMTMLMHRGRLITTRQEPEPDEVAARLSELIHPLFAPSYVAKARRYTLRRYLQIFGYFQLRGLVFKAWSRLSGDPLRYHLLEAGQPLGYKARLGDVRILRLFDRDWRSAVAEFPVERRAFFGLQLIPEAAIDYWVEDLDLVRHEETILRAAQLLSRAGYAIVVKDHPLQFGFRRTDFIEALRAIRGTVIIPYEVSGNEALAECGAVVTATGTLGLQGALMGKTAVTGEAYYATEEDFLILRDRSDLERLPETLAAWRPGDDLETRRRRIVAHLLRGSFEGDFHSWRPFDLRRPSEAATRFGRQLGERLRRLGPGGEDWHRRALPPGGGRHPGSPLD